jgi:RNA polymerase sigma-B factor
VPTATSLAAPPTDRATTDELHLSWAEERDPAAHEELVKRYQGLVRRQASRHGTRHDAFDDHMQVANVGLLNALARFEPGRGRPFRAFAVPTIAGELRRNFRNTRWALHVPRGLQEKFLLVERATDLLTTRLGRSPTPAELAAHVGLREESVLEAIGARNGYDAVSLDGPPQPAPNDGRPLDLLDAIGREEPGYDLVAYRQAIAGTMRALPDRERAILRLRFVDDLTQAEIAERLGTCRCRSHGSFVALSPGYGWSPTETTRFVDSSGWRAKPRLSRARLAAALTAPGRRSGGRSPGRVGRPGARAWSA